MLNIKTKLVLLALGCKAHSQPFVGRVKLIVEDAHGMLLPVTLFPKSPNYAVRKGLEHSFGKLKIARLFEAAAQLAKLK